MSDFERALGYAGINSSFPEVRGTDNFLTEGILYFSLSIIAQVIEYSGERHSHFPDISSKFCAASLRNVIAH